MKIKNNSQPVRQHKNKAWVKWNPIGLTIHAKVYDEPSCYGINDGRISKLYIKDRSGNEIYCYDRGLDRNEIDPDLLAEIIARLEKMPTTEDEA